MKQAWLRCYAWIVFYYVINVVWYGTQAGYSSSLHICSVCVCVSVCLGQGAVSTGQWRSNWKNQSNSRGNTITTDAFTSKLYVTHMYVLHIFVFSLLYHNHFSWFIFDHFTRAEKKKTLQCVGQGYARTKVGNLWPIKYIDFTKAHTTYLTGTDTWIFMSHVFIAFNVTFVIIRTDQWGAWESQTGHGREG